MKRNIILTGFMGTGKTTAGQKTAELLGREFIDLDGLIEEREKLTISRIFEIQGENYFRRRESELLKEILFKTEAVIASGGGTLIASENRKLAEGGGIIFCLTARSEIIRERVNGYNHRPLLGDGNLEERISELLKTREGDYSSFANQIDTSDLKPQQVAQIIVRKYRELNAIESNI